MTFTGPTVRFTPAANFFGTTTFTYTISDGNGGTATAHGDGDGDGGERCAGCRQRQPSAWAPTAGANPLDVLANDTTMPDAGETLTITAVTQPANGTVTNNGTNVTFTPGDELHAAPTTFTYTISDGNGGTDTATVTVTVANNPPDANADSYTVAEDSGAHAVQRAGQRHAPRRTRARRSASPR